MKEAFLVQLDPKEEVLGIVRRSPFFKWWKWLIVVIWLLLPFFFFYPLMELGGVGILIFLALFISAIWNAWRRRQEWLYTMFIVTDSRVIDVDQHGLLKRSVSELAMKDVSDVSVRQTRWQKIVNLGTVRIETSEANQFDLELTGVHNPQRIRNLIVDVQYVTGDYVDQAKAKKDK